MNDNQYNNYSNTEIINMIDDNNQFETHNYQQQSHNNSHNYSN